MINGLNSLSYLGVGTQSPPQVIINESDPTDKNYQFPLGTLWINKSDDSSFMLTDVRRRVASWSPFGGNMAGASNFITDMGTAVVDGSDINIKGDPPNPITTVGSAMEVTIKETSGDDGEIIIGRTGGEPIWSSLTSSDNSITITPGPNTIDLTITNPNLLDQINTDVASPVIPVADEINVFGGDLITTSASTLPNDTLYVELDNGSNGQLIIGGDPSPSWNNLSSPLSSVLLTEGAGTLGLDAAPKVPTSFLLDDTNSALPLANTLLVKGTASGASTSSAGDEYLMIGIKSYNGVVSFTPSVTALSSAPTGVTYGTRYGYYSEIGSRKFVNLYIEIVSKGSGGSGFLKINGAPASIFNVTTFFVRTENLNLSSNNGVSGYAVTNASNMRLTQPNAGLNQLSWGIIKNGSIIHIAGVLI